MSAPACSIEARALSKTYFRGSEEVCAVDAVSLRVLAGEFVSFVGSSGSGKTTLLNLLGCLDNPTRGELDLDGRPIVSAGAPLSERELTRIRRETFGYIFQSFYLIPTLSVLENVLLPLTFYRSPRADGDALAILERLGIANRRNHLPDQISGGEMQRVAIARALVTDPAIIIADEPTGNLDSFAGGEILALLRKYNRERGVTIVLVTHSHLAAAYGDRIITLRDGQIVDETVNRPPKSAPQLRPVS
jgi:putative ABC transport system ATP-binding protein